MGQFVMTIPVELGEDAREEAAETVIGVFEALKAAGAQPVVTSDFSPQGDRWEITYREVTCAGAHG